MRLSASSGVGHSKLPSVIGEDSATHEMITSYRASHIARHLARDNDEIGK
jgi:hypothetical protein